MNPSRHRSTRAWVLALTSVASLMVALDVLVVTTALTRIRLSLGASVETLEWTVNAYNLSFAVLLLTGVALGDRLGRVRVFAVGLALFVAASAACALADNVASLIVGRALQGAGAALVAPLGMALLSAAFEPQERAKALGLYSGITGLALITGPAVGGAVTEGLAWQWIFWINVPIGLLLIPLALMRIPESRGSSRRIDLGGLALVTAAAFCMVWSLMRGNKVGWISVEELAVTIGAVVLSVAFVAWELRVSEPMVPMRFFQARPFASGSAAGFFMNAALYGAVFFMAQFLQTAQGHGPLAAGLRLLPWTATLFLVAPVSGAIVNRVGERTLITVGLLLNTAGLAWIAAIATPGVAYQQLVAPLVVAGAGISMSMPPAQGAIMKSVLPTDLAKAAGAYNMLRLLGGVFGVATAVAVFARAGSMTSTVTFSRGFAYAIGACAAWSFLGALAGAFQPAPPKTKLLRDEAHGTV